MNNRLINCLRFDLWFGLFATAHLIGWTLMPAWVRENLPLDSIEGTVWGHQLQWGYDKNPFLNGWLTALAGSISYPSGWVIYLFSQLSVVLCFWAIWKLAKQILSPPYALIAVLLLECIQYYNFHAIDFNDNILELGTWALTVYFFYQALRKPRYANWLVTGLFAALGMMAKYYTATLLAAMVLLLLTNKTHRRQLASPLPYAGFALFLLLILPHVIWLFFHDFITVTYVFERASSVPRWTNHFFFPMQFAWQQFEVFLPALIFFGFLFIGKKPLTANPRPLLAADDRSFLFFVGLGPFLLTLLLSFTLGIKLRAGWGMPLQSLWPLLLIALIPPRLDPKKIVAFIAVIFLLMTGLMWGYRASLVNSPNTSSANFPGQEIAATITQQWRETYHMPLSYVAGSRWIGGNIEFYSPDHPAVFVEWDTHRAPWINLNELREKGAVFVWDVSAGETLPPTISAAFPQLKPAKVLYFNWRRNQHQLFPEQVGMAVLPPRNKLSIAEAAY